MEPPSDFDLEDFTRLLRERTELSRFGVVAHASVSIPLSSLAELVAELERQRLTQRAVVLGVGSAPVFVSADELSLEPMPGWVIAGLDASWVIWHTEEQATLLVLELPPAAQEGSGAGTR